MCLDGPGRKLPILANPIQAHTAIFGSLAMGEAGRMFTDNVTLIEHTLKQTTKAAGAFAGSSRERAKLENYATSLEEVRNQYIRLLESEATLRTVAGATGIDPEDGSLLQSAHPLLRLESQYRLASAALQGDLTRTVLLTSSVGNAFSHTKYTSLRTIFQEDSNFDGEVPWRHGVCHEAGKNQTYQKVLDHVIKRQVEMIAKLARDLAAIPVSHLFSTLGHVAGYQGRDLHFGGEPGKERTVSPLGELLAS